MESVGAAFYALAAVGVPSIRCASRLKAGRTHTALPYSVDLVAHCFVSFYAVGLLACHDARNTYATLYLEQGGRPEVLKKLLGHSDIKQTMRYVKITEKAVIDDYIKMTNITNKGKIVELKQPA